MTSSPGTEIATAHGPARVEFRGAPTGRLLVLGHGAGGGTHAPDLQIAADAAVGLRWQVALVDQPYRVAGRKAPPRAPVLDEAWRTVVATLREDVAALVVGGRSSGARVACRTSTEVGAQGVLCLAFPLHPPGHAGDPSRSRLPELDAVEAPLLVVQGSSDPFGRPSPAPGRHVVLLRGNHALTSDLPGVRSAVEEWLTSLG